MSHEYFVDCLMSLIVCRLRFLSLLISGDVPIFHYDCCFQYY